MEGEKLEYLAIANGLEEGYEPAKAVDNGLEYLMEEDDDEYWWKYGEQEAYVEAKGVSVDDYEGGMEFSAEIEAASPQAPEDRAGSYGGPATV